MPRQDRPNEQFLYERPKTGVHFSQWKATSTANRKTILRSLSRAGLLNWLNRLGLFSPVQPYQTASEHASSRA